MVAAHPIGPRHGRKIQTDEPIRATMKRTPSKLRVMSVRGSIAF
jgi:hypothetical protein